VLVNKVLSVHKKPFCAWRTSAQHYLGVAYAKGHTQKFKHTKRYVHTFHFPSANSPSSGRKGSINYEIILLQLHSGIPVFGTRQIDGPKIHTTHSICKHGPVMTLPNRKVQSCLHVLYRTDRFGSANLPERRRLQHAPPLSFRIAVSVPSGRGAPKVGGEATDRTWGCHFVIPWIRVLASLSALYSPC